MGRNKIIKARCIACGLLKPVDHYESDGSGDKAAICVVCAAVISGETPPNLSVK